MGGTGNLSLLEELVVLVKAHFSYLHPPDSPIALCYTGLMLGLHSLPWLLVIELGDFRLNSATPWSEVAWFMAGVLILAGLSYLVLRLNRQPRPDPFDLGHEG